MLAKDICLALGISDPESVVAVDRMITGAFKSEEFRKEKIYKVAFNATPPHSEEVESAFIGCMLLNPSRAIAANAAIREEFFYTDRYRLMWRAAKALYDRGALISPVSIADFLKDTQVSGVAADVIIGGQYGVEESMFGHTKWEESEQYADRLRQYYLQRASMDACMNGLTSLYELDPSLVMDARGKIVSTLIDLGARFSGNDFSDGASISEKILSHLNMMKDWKDAGIPPQWALTPVDELNLLTGGWKPANLIIFAARPGMGKTAYLVSEADYAINRGESVGIFSLEMSELELGLRFLSMNTLVSSDMVRTGEISNREIIAASKYLERMKSMGLYIDDTPGLRIDLLEQRASVMKERFGVKRIYVDYIQLVTTTAGGNREQAVADVSARLKGLAKRLDIPVIVFSQLSRAVETRGGTKKPMLSDLRESGSIEQDADVVGFLYRSEYYNIKTDEDGNLIEHAEIIIEKYRQGKTGTVKAKFFGHVGKWTNFVQAPMSTAPSIDDLTF